MGSASPRPVAVSCRRDVSLDVELTARFEEERALTQDSNLLGKFLLPEALHGVGGHVFDAHKNSFANEWDRPVNETGKMWKNEPPFCDAH